MSMICFVRSKGRIGFSRKPGMPPLDYHRFYKAFDDGEIEQLSKTECVENNKMRKRPSVVSDFK